MRTVHRSARRYILHGARLRFAKLCRFMQNISENTPLARTVFRNNARSQT